MSSYGSSLHPGRLTEGDLFKEDVSYERLGAVIDNGELADETWSNAGRVFNSAVRAKGAKYV